VTKVINIVPILLAIYALIDGTGTLAGQEDDGKLELIVAWPWQRGKIPAGTAGNAWQITAFGFPGAWQAPGSLLEDLLAYPPIATNLSFEELLLPPK
jgi:hypothetical protein